MISTELYVTQFSPAEKRKQGERGFWVLLSCLLLYSPAEFECVFSASSNRSCGVIRASRNSEGVLRDKV